MIACIIGISLNWDHAILFFISERIPFTAGVRLLRAKIVSSRAAMFTFRRRTRWSNLISTRESWGRAATVTKIGGSQESNMPLVNAIQPFASRRLAWLYRGATAGSGADRILSVAAALRRWRWWQVGEVCGVLYPSLAIPHTVPQLMESPRLAFWRMLRELRPSHVSASSCVADSQRTESLPPLDGLSLNSARVEGTGFSLGYKELPTRHNKIYYTHY